MTEDARVSSASSSASRWGTVLAWFLVSAVASTYLNTQFLNTFESSPNLLTLVRFFGSACIGLVTTRGVLDAAARFGARFALPALLLVGANGFNSLSLQLSGITVTYVMKASIPIISLCVIVMKRKSFAGVTLFTACSLIPVCLGVGLAAWAEAELTWLGFLAAFASAVSQALLNLVSKERISASNVSGREAQVLLTTIAALVTVLGVVVFSEADREAARAAWRRVEARPTAEGGLLVFTVLSYHVEYVLNFVVTKDLSEMEFAVCDAARRLTIVLAGAALFNKPLGPVNLLGAVTAVTGVTLYSYASQLARKRAEETHAQVEALASMIVKEKQVSKSGGQEKDASGEKASGRE